MVYEKSCSKPTIAVFEFYHLESIRYNVWVLEMLMTIIWN
jgi:hypothetical protein